ncbi:MAG: DUF3365 domain-containing protein [Candidatus Marithrix sp.]
MKYLCLMIAISLSSSAVFATENMDAKLDNYRSAVGKLMKTLKPELVNAMKSKGPVAAIEVCNTKSPTMTDAVSKDAGFVIQRTSLKPRNASNTPDEWETKVLNQFEDRKAKGENPKTIEFYEIVENDGKRQIRYMKAIPTSQPCAVCHGEMIPPPVQAKLRELYPNDKAVGFKVGDLRGAFSIIDTITQ